MEIDQIVLSTLAFSVAMESDQRVVETKRIKPSSPSTCLLLIDPTPSLFQNVPTGILSICLWVLRSTGHPNQTVPGRSADRPVLSARLA